MRRAQICHTYWISGNIGFVSVVILPSYCDELFLIMFLPTLVTSVRAAPTANASRTKNCCFCLAIRKKQLLICWVDFSTSIDGLLFKKLLRYFSPVFGSCWGWNVDTAITPSALHEESKKKVQMFWPTFWTEYIAYMYVTQCCCWNARSGQCGSIWRLARGFLFSVIMPSISAGRDGTNGWCVRCAEWRSYGLLTAVPWERGCISASLAKKP